MPKDDGESSRRHSWFRWIVTSIIVVLVGLLALVMSTLRIHPDPRIRTVNLISELTIACEAYRLDYNCYPWPEPGQVSSSTKIEGKAVAGALWGENASHHVFFDDTQRMQYNRNGKGSFVDRWGHEIIFRVNPKTRSAVIWSCGPNGQDETNTGASPDPAKFPKTYYLFKGPSTGDDIVSE